MSDNEILDVILSALHKADNGLHLGMDILHPNRIELTRQRREIIEQKLEILDLAIEILSVSGADTAYKTSPHGYDIMEDHGSYLSFLRGQKRSKSIHILNKVFTNSKEVLLAIVVIASGILSYRAYKDDLTIEEQIKQISTQAEEIQAMKKTETKAISDLKSKNDSLKLVLDSVLIAIP